jgi:putative sterol carrier protein
MRLSSKGVDVAQDAQAVLAEAVKDKSDEEINELLGTMGGTETVLDMTFQGMAEAVNPEKAQDCVIGYKLTEGDKTYMYKVTIADKKASYEKADPAGARVTMGLSVPDYLRLISGNLDGMQAFMGGKLKLEGDMMFAQQVAGMFGM